MLDRRASHRETDRPGDAANPHIGKVGALEETPEVRVETLCVGEDVVKGAVAALKG